MAAAQVVKTRMQLQSRAVSTAAASDAAPATAATAAAAGGRYRSSYQTVLSILREDGPRGFYRGLVPRNAAIRHSRTHK